MRSSIASLFLVSLPAVLGHGYMKVPKSRNLINPTFCPDCGSGGGKFAVEQRILAGNFSFPDGYPSEGTHGLCGNPDDDRALVPIANQTMMVATEPTSVYTEGDVLEVTMDIVVDHGGYMEVRICDHTLDTSLESQAAGQLCLDQHVLERLHPFATSRKGECGTPDAPVSPTDNTDCAPIDPTYPTRSYVPPYALLNSDTSPLSFKMKFELPSGLQCEACTMQLYWHTADGCTPPGYAEYYDLLHAAHPDTAAEWPGFVLPAGYECSTEQQTEQYWNCADIAILPQPEGGECEDGEGSIPMYGNCTGQHSGCCEQGLQCLTLNDEYAQCRKADTCPCSWDCQIVPPPCPAVIPLYGNCRSSHCCAEGLVCYEQDSSYAQCLEPMTCPGCSGWSCAELLHGLHDV